MKQEPGGLLDQDTSSPSIKPRYDRGPHQKRERMIRIELPRGGKRGGGRIIEDEEEDEMKELAEKIKKAGLPEHALKAAQKELKVPRLILVSLKSLMLFDTQRLRSLPAQFPEHAVSR